MLEVFVRWIIGFTWGSLELPSLDLMLQIYLGLSGNFDVITIAYGVVVSMFVCHCSDWGLSPGRAVKFDIANLYINSALRQ